MIARRSGSATRQAPRARSGRSREPRHPSKPCRVGLASLHDPLLARRANLAGLGRAASNVTITRGDWFDALHPGLIADVIVTNPPYVAAGSPDLDDVVARWEPASALMAGPDGLDAIRRIVGGARGHLTEGGWLLIEHGHDQGAAVRGLFEDAGFESVETHRDLAGRERVTSGRT